jgi:hypothetical protein
MPSRAVFLQGYGFHLIPDSSNSGPLPYPSWESGTGKEFVLLSYGKDGKLLLTNNKEPPPRVPGWTFFQPFIVSKWEAEVGGWKWTLLHQYEDGLSVFAGIVI